MENVSRPHVKSAFMVALAARTMRQTIGNVLILFGAHLISVQIVLRFLAGVDLPAGYTPHSATVLSILVVAGTVSALIGNLVTWQPEPPRYMPFAMCVLTLFISLIAYQVWLPHFVQIQHVYYLIAAIIIAVLTLIVAEDLYARRSPLRFADHLIRLWQTRYLPLLWLRYNIEVRYSQTLLGILWIALLPLATASVLSIAFSEILQVRFDVPFVAFLLAALLPWGLFSQSIGNSTQIIMVRMATITQVAFPREVVLVTVLGEALIDLSFTLVATLIVTTLSGIPLALTLLYLLPLLVILMGFTLGCMLFISTISPFVRDIPQLTAVILQLLLYLSPILYPLDRIPDRLRGLILLNPLVTVIHAFREVIVYHRAPDLVSLYYPVVVGSVLLYVGYAFFKAHEQQFADLV